MISFIVPGEPVAKGRPRATTVNGRARMYTPNKTASYESRVAIFASQAMAGRAPLDGPVSLRIEAVFAMPASWSKKRTAACLVNPELVIKRPDGDNVLKAVCDALNGIAYKDDSQVSLASVMKVYGPLGMVSVALEAMQ